MFRDCEAACNLRTRRGDHAWLFRYRLGRACALQGGTYPVEMTEQVRYVKLIHERDVYRLVIRSKLAAAEAFKGCGVGKALPSIRKTGSYVRA